MIGVRFFVERPVFTTMMLLIAVAIGATAFLRLPVDLLPVIETPRLTVVTSHPNAAPAEIEDAITRPVEDVVSAVPGLEELRSTSAEGVSEVVMSFAWGTDLDAAANDVRDRLERILSDLPDEADRPRIRKFDTASSPILRVGVSGPIDQVSLFELADQRMRDAIQRVPGVAAVDIWGGRAREVQVDLDRHALRGLSLSVEEVRLAIGEANQRRSAGEVRRGVLERGVRTPGTFDTLDELRATRVGAGSNGAIALDRIAEVRDGGADETRIVRIQGEPGLRLAVRKQSDANTVAVASGVMKAVEDLRERYPELEFVVIRDQSDYIQRAMDNLGMAVVYGALAASVVLLVFLRSLAITLITASAIPISLVASFALVYFGGYTLNVMTLGGLALAVGLIVDNAIVVTENIARLRREEGLSAREAAVEGARQVAPPIVAGTLTTMAVFLPLAFARDLSGRLFEPLAAVVAFTLLASLLVALTLVPTLSARLKEEGQAAAKPRRSLLDRGYERVLGAALQARWTVVACCGLLMVAAFALMPRIGVEFLPDTDESEVGIFIEMEAGTRLDVLDRTMADLLPTVLRAVPEARAHVVSSGGSPVRAANPAEGSIRLALVPPGERTRSSQEIASALRAELAPMAGVDQRVWARGSAFRLSVGLFEDDDPLRVVVRGRDLERIEALAGEVQAGLREIAGITSVRVDRPAQIPQDSVRIDRARAADLGVSVSDAARTLETAVGGTDAGDFRAGGDTFPIRVRLADARSLGREDLLDITVPNSGGAPVALRNFAQIVPEESPSRINRVERSRSIVVSADYAGRDLGAVAAEARGVLSALSVPESYEVVLEGDEAERQEAFQEFVIMFLFAIALVYMVMACLYESLRDPLVVMMSVPAAAVGVVVMLWLTGTTFNVQTLIGILMLVGIIVNNAILLVDQSERLRRESGFTVMDAAREAGRRRLRPILMTTATTIAALLPLAVGIGEGSEAQAPMARAVVGGLTGGTLVTLVLVPVVYTLFHAERRSAERSGAVPVAG